LCYCCSKQGKMRWSDLFHILFLCLSFFLFLRGRSLIISSLSLFSFSSPQSGQSPLDMVRMGTSKGSALFRLMKKWMVSPLPLCSTSPLPSLFCLVSDCRRGSPTITEPSIRIQTNPKAESQTETKARTSSRVR
jgi:hypothetical protein